MSFDYSVLTVFSSRREKGKPDTVAKKKKKEVRIVGLGVPLRAVVIIDRFHCRYNKL